MGAQFRRGEEPVNDHEAPPVPGGLVFQLPAELSPAGVADALREAMVFDHVSDGEVFDGDQVVAADQVGAGLVEEVSAGVGYPGVGFRDPGLGLGSVFRALLFAGHHPLVSGEALFFAAQDLRVWDPLAVGGDQEVLQPQVDADGCLGWGQRFDVLVDEDAHMPAAGGVPGHGYRGWLGIVGQGAAESQVEGVGEFREEQLALTPPEPPTGVLHGLVSVAGFEPWVSGAFGEEVVERRLLVAQDLLEGDAGDLGQEACGLGLFQYGQLGGELVIADTLAADPVPLGALGQGPVPHEADASEGTVQLRRLLGRRVEPVPVRPLHTVIVSQVKRPPIGGLPLTRFRGRPSSSPWLKPGVSLGGFR